MKQKNVLSVKKKIPRYIDALFNKSTFNISDLDPIQ